jgi:endonuclease YncB( thermonuclease family)
MPIALIPTTASVARFTVAASGLVCAAGLLASLSADQQRPEQRDSSAAMQAAPVPQPSAGTSTALRRAPFPGPYTIDLVRTVDGDTFEARVRIWFGQEVTSLVRIRGIDAPELRARCASERIRAESSRDALDAELRGGNVTISDVVPDKYFGRIVASVRIAAAGREQDVGAWMLEQNHARAYDGRKRAGWCETAALD